MKRIVAVFLTMLVFFTSPVCARVITTQNTDGYTGYVYVAGSPDKYPIEYYDEKTDEYKGVIPDMLESISRITKIDFVYINGNKDDKFSMGDYMQVDIVSCVSTKEKLLSGKEYIELVSYEKDGEVENCGLLFTEVFDDEIIAQIYYGICPPDGIQGL